MFEFSIKFIENGEFYNVWFHTTRDTNRDAFVIGIHIALRLFAHVMLIQVKPRFDYAFLREMQIKSSDREKKMVIIEQRKG